MTFTSVTDHVNLLPEGVQMTTTIVAYRACVILSSRSKGFIRENIHIRVSTNINNTQNYNPLPFLIQLT
jgi:hypothetical protein